MEENSRDTGQELSSFVGTVTSYGMDGSITGCSTRFSASTPALDPTQPHVQWVQGAVSLAMKLLGYDAHHSHLVLRLRMHGVIPTVHMHCMALDYAEG
jgi:hypothetical protein